MNISPPAHGALARRVIVYTPEPGAGAGQYVAEFSKALAALGETTVLLCPANFAYEKEVRAAGVEIVHLPLRDVTFAGVARRLWRNFTFTARGVATLAGTVRRGDVVHFQFAPHFGLALVSFAAARLKGARVLLTVHDPLPHRWILPRALRWVEIALAGAGYAACRHLIVHNQTGKLVLTRRFRVSPAKLSLIPHGPLSPLAPALLPTEAPGPAEPLRLLAFGSLRENKGLHLSIAAVQQLQHAPGLRPVVLTIAGCVANAMEKRYWEGCRRLIEEQPAGIHTIERAIDDAEVPALFAAHDALLLPYGEFFSDSGVAMLALSQRRPILATSAGGLGELLRAADCGIAIEEPSVAAVVAAIEKARAAGPELLLQKGLNGYRYALADRSWPAIAGRTRQVYDTLRAAPRSGPRVVLHTPEPASSAALYLEALAGALTAQNVPLAIVCPANHQARAALERNPAIDVRLCAARATRVDVSLPSKIAANLRFMLSSAGALLGAARAGDIVHFQYILHLPFGLFFLLCAWLKRAHIVLTVHDPMPHKFLLRPFLRRLEILSLGWAYQWSDALIVHSDAGRKKLIDTFRLPPEKIHVVVHGPYPLPGEVRSCAETNRLEVLFFGSLRENKAPDLAIEAVQQLARAGVAVRLTIAGEVVNRKEEAYWERSRALIDEQCGAVRLREEFVPNEELPELFSGCHCLVLPYTTFYSDSGVAYMALANAKPIVATGSGGLAWLLENSGGGLAIAEGTVAGVAEALRRAAALGPAGLERLGRRGADWVLSNCGWPRVAEDTRQVYARFIPQFRLRETPAEASAAATPVGVSQ